MKKTLYLISLLGLLLTLLPPGFFALGWLGESAMKNLMLAGVLLWFSSWPLALRTGTVASTK